MAMALYEPVSVVVPLRLCSTPESMDEKSSESDVSRPSSPQAREETSSIEAHGTSSDNKKNREELKSPPETTPPPMSTVERGGYDSASSNTLHQSPSSSQCSQQRYASTPLPATSHDHSGSPAGQASPSLRRNHLPSPSPSSSSSSAAAATVVCSSSPSSRSQVSVNTTGRIRGHVTPSKSGQPSPITSASTGGSNNSTSDSGGGTVHPPMLFSQSDITKAGAENNNMLTLSSYVQFMTLQQQGQIGYPALLPSACLPQSTTNPPTTLPPQYDTQAYSPSLPSTLQTFGAAATNKFNGLFPQQLNQGLIALDMPMAATGTPHSKHGGLNIGFDQSRFMVGGPLSGALPGHEVAQAVGSVGVPLVVTSRNDVGVGAMGGAGGNGGYKRSRKRPYSQTNSDMQDASDMHGYRRSVFPSEDHHCGNQITDSHTTGSGVLHSSSSSSSSGGVGGGGGGAPQQLKWQAHQVDTWHDLCDGALQDIPQIGFTVETDKGFVFSVADDTFVCQKKNHFQVTVTTIFHRTPKFIKIKGGSIQPVEKFTLRLHGVKLESVNTKIRLEQSMTDRRRSDFEPIEVQVPQIPEEPAKHTACRLHFGETTSNNMRKRGKPNPDQKFFSLVVGLDAVCELGSFPVVAHVSERIIVRASNPGNFDNDCDYLWLKSATPDSIYHHGRVGINTDKPEEALTVNGNIRVTGRIEHPSDMRIKTNIEPVDNGRQLESVCQMKIYQYQYREGMMTGANSKDENRRQVGVMAQELRQILPDAVHETSTDVVLSDGSRVSRLLVIDKDRILMETVGAVKELKRIADDMSRRFEVIEKDISLRAVQTHCTCTLRKTSVTNWMLSAATYAILLVILCFLVLLPLKISTWTFC